MSGGSGSPVASIAAPPTSASRASNGAQASSTRSAARVTSGPMPSPGSTAIFGFMESSRGPGPRPSRRRRCRLSCDEQEGELVLPVRAGSGARTARAGTDAFRPSKATVPSATSIVTAPGAGRERLVRGLVHLHRQQAVLERVAAEDVGERGADHGAEAAGRAAPTPRARARSRSRSCCPPRAPARPRPPRGSARSRASGAPRRRSASRRTGPCRGRRAWSCTFRKRAGMIWSVSTSSTAAARPCATSGSCGRRAHA